jgi:hypothetical protein
MIKLGFERQYTISYRSRDVTLYYRSRAVQCCRVAVMKNPTHLPKTVKKFAQNYLFYFTVLRCSEAGHSNYGCGDAKLSVIGACCCVILDSTGE